MFRKNKEKNTCSHNWIHNAGKQCEWSRIYTFEDCLRGLSPDDIKGDSNEITYMYICTMCGEEYWSSYKSQDIPHYRVRSQKWKNKNERKNKNEKI